MLGTTACPECGHAAEVQWYAALNSTDGPVGHARIYCVNRHIFLLPVSALAYVDDEQTSVGGQATAAVRARR